MRRFMQQQGWVTRVLCAALLVTMGAAATAQNAPVTIAVVAGFTGSQAPSSDMWISGIRVAAAEINAQGGILGHQVKIDTYDYQSQPTLSLAEMRKALQTKPYAVLGTILSGATIINYPILQDAGVPQFTGSVNPQIEAKNPTFLFDTEPNASLEAKMFADWAVKNASVKRVDIVYGNDSFGESGMQSFADLFTSAGAQVVDKISTSIGQTNYSGVVAKIQQDKPDAVFMYMHETETGKFLVQAAAAGLNSQMKFLGASSALSPATLKIAGQAANGVQGFVPFTATAPSLQALGQKYAATHGGNMPDHNYYKGYMALWAITYATQAIGKLDQKAMNDWLHERTLCVSKYPNLLGDTYWRPNGDLDIHGFVVKVQDGKQVLSDTTPAADPSHLASCM